jgi:hypothetical protein
MIARMMRATTRQGVFIQQLCAMITTNAQPMHASRLAGVNTQISQAAVMMEMHARLTHAIQNRVA